MITAQQLRAGMAIRIERAIYEVLDSEFKAGGGQAGGTVKAKLRNLESGRMWEPHFRPDERLEELAVERQPMEYLYSDDDNCYFMNMTTFEQVELKRTAIGDSAQFLKEGMQTPVGFFDGRPIKLDMPPSVELEVVDTAPAQRSSQDSTWKEAKLENGIKILVPLFIASGELVRVDVKSGRYLERVRLERKKGA